MKITSYVRSNLTEKTENYEVFRVIRPKIARDVHSSKHRKLRKRKLRGRKLRGHGVYTTCIACVGVPAYLSEYIAIYLAI